ncbi:MAG: carbonic anhydrase [Planctomycetales bacterium]
MSEPISRRTMMTGTAALTLCFTAESPGEESQKDASPVQSAEEALRRLKEGNQRFVTGKTLHAHESADWRKHLVATQAPFATILGCSDSRVPIELVFDQGFGELFVIRVAGNVIAPDIVGSIAYAFEHLHNKLFVVMGHESCGAVTAALAERKKPTEKAPAIKALVKLISPGLPPVSETVSSEQAVSAAVEANVRYSMRQLLLNPRSQRSGRAW